MEATPPVACARRVEEAASDRGDGAGDFNDDVGDGIERGVGAAA